MKRDLSKIKEKDLAKEISENKKKLQDISFSVSGSTSKDSFEKRKIKREVARLNTELNKR